LDVPWPLILLGLELPERVILEVAKGHQRYFGLRDAAKSEVHSPENLVSWSMDRMTAATFPGDSYNALIDYAHAGGAWNGSDTQIAAKASGLAHLIVGSGEYQLV